MINKLFKSELIAAGILLLILFAFVRPSGLLMPQNFEMMLPIILIVAFFVFTSLFWKEKSRDEREDLHRLLASRISFLIGSTTLTVGIVIQSLSHQVDPWLVVTLSLMILAKATSRVYSRAKK